MGTDADFAPGSLGRTDLSLADAYVVKSREVEVDNLYFVPARIQGRDTEDRAGVKAIDDQPVRDRCSPPTRPRRS